MFHTMINSGLKFNFCLLIVAYSLLFSIFVENVCYADEVLGCNGFVKSNVGEIDFTKVEIKISIFIGLRVKWTRRNPFSRVTLKYFERTHQYTKQGSLKDYTECAPNNGYYFLPLYDKGEYILKVSSTEGWYFEPNEVVINVDGATDSCSLGIDINFVLKGFTIAGKVTSLDNDDGPKGVEVQLISLSSTPEVLITTFTQEGGNFILSPVKPGQYLVQATHERWHMAKKQASVLVKNGNIKTEPNSLVVSGYDVSGSVISDGEPITGVIFVLFQQAGVKQIPVIGCDSSALTGFSPTGLDLKGVVPLCHVVSDSKGHFTFPSIPPGKYTVVPYYKGVHSIKFDVQPQDLAFEVRHGSLELPTIFQVKGFSVEGRLLWSEKGKPFEDALVIVNKKVVSKTGNNGVFHLDGMTPGIYKLSFEARDVLFEERDVKVSPNTPNIGDMVPSSYRVCGRVSTSQGNSLAADRSVEFTRQPDGPVHSVITDSTGNFCVFLPQATFSVTVPISDAERGSGVQFAPLKRSLKVADSPVTGMDFAQLQATVVGSIECLVSPCPEIAVSLQSQETSTVLSKGGKYTFEQVLPGEYTVSISTHNHCWKTNEFSLSVFSELVKSPVFIQTGFPIYFDSSHSTNVQYKRDDNSSKMQEVELPAGSSTVCVPSTGVYVIEPVGCHGYASPKIRWTEGVVHLDAVTHLYTGRILTSDSVSDLVVNVIPLDDLLTESSSVRRLGPLTAVKKAGAVEYEFSTQLAPGEAVTLVPSASSLLFSPAKEVVVGGQDCVVGVVFRAERGHVIKGRVLGNSNPVPGASVTIRNTEGQLIDSQVTNSEGHYMFGPLSANIKYNVTAEKEGYIISGPNSKGDFNAHKLAEVIVTVNDKSNGLPLQGVLLSLSGGENYRRNSQTGPEGTMTFLSLSPSEYYLRPMMKEYKFDPPSKMIAVKEGATVQVTLSGEKVAYSVFGSVTSLSGEPEPGVVVEAVGLGKEQCLQLQEESSTEANGHFRIRGLQPQCEYSIRLKRSPLINQHIQRSTPEGIQVKVTKEDVHGLNMIVFRPISRTDISVYVTAGTPEHLRSLKVKMSRDDSTVHSVRLSTLKATPSCALKSTAIVFPPVPADGRIYSIQLESSLSQKTHNFRTHPVYFKANTSFQMVRLNFVTSVQSGESELSHTSYFALPIFLLALLVFYNRDSVKILVTKVMESKLNAQDNNSTNQIDDSSGDSLTVEQVLVKKKAKQRKT